MVSLTTEQLDALCGAATDGVDFDGLSVERTPDGYRFAAGSTVEDALGETGLRRVAEDASAYVANWHFWERTVDATTAGRAYLRWLERAGASDTAVAADAAAEPLTVPQRYDRLADGIDREWGQVCLTTFLTENGHRRYRLRHIDDVGDQGDDATGDHGDDATGDYGDDGGGDHGDAGGGEDALEVLDGRRDLIDRLRYDDRGRYRPLKTAPTLQTGWVLPAVEWSAVIDAVGEIYPATIENWYRERQGTLDVDHYRETAERQTGIYDVVDELPRAALEWVTEACCVDSQCLKRRQWDEAPDDELDVPRGDGAFPCREPCSLLIAAARKWTRLEREESQTYEFELTPSEKAQLDAIVDAVADGRSDAIREADVTEGANRYRVRYLRAKRFEDGGFPE